MNYRRLGLLAEETELIEQHGQDLGLSGVDDCSTDRSMSRSASV